MPEGRPGFREVVTATKACVHGDPVVELGIPGAAAKSEQAAAMAPSVANAAIAQQIAINEEFVIITNGTRGFLSSKLPAGAAAGDALYIKTADNTLHLAADAVTAGVLNAGFLKFGRLVSIDTAAGRCEVNLNLRSAF